MHFKPRFLGFLRFLWNFWIGCCLIDTIWSCIAFHWTFTMFHAFRCVLDCWKLCAGRFGLGFMHMYPFFYFFVLFCDCVLFLSSLSLSLSLSLLDGLRMAPKRKSNPTRNPFHSGSSSSSDLPVLPLHVRFHDEKAHQDFSKNFSKHGVHPKCHVILSNFADTPLPDVIHIRGWESLCEILLRCPILFIQEFYSNMHSIDTSVPQFTMVLRGTRIIVTLDLVFEIVHVPRVAHPNYPGCQCLGTMSKYELLSHFCEIPSI